MTPPSYRVGSATITKIQEMTVDALAADQLYVGIDPAVAKEQASRWGAGSVDPASGHLKLGFHSWLVQTPSHTVLVDTGAGAEKERPSSPMFGNLHEPFLARLRTAGAGPEDIDAVLHTHLHVDHVGWNTFKSGDRWVPTFPNAQYLFSAREHAYVRSISQNDGADEAVKAAAGLGPMHIRPTVDFYPDSVLPVVEAGLTREIDVAGSEVLEGFTYHSTPGHSIDHGSISFVSEGERAFFWGDVVHHPIQFALPTWNSVFCEFPDAAIRSRAWAVAHAAESQSLVFATHLAETSVGRVSGTPGDFRWDFV